LCFKEAAFLAQETAAATEEGELQAILLAMLQEQHDKQIVAMTATNKASMDVLMERMNALVADGGDAGRPNSTRRMLPPGEQAHPPPQGQTKPRNPGNKRPSVPIAKMFALHILENCYNFEASKDKRWPG
jgi:hypothetical protein